MRFVLTTFSLIFLGMALTSCATQQRTDGVEKKSPSEIAQMYSELGTSALLRGEYAQAIEDLRKALEHDSKNAMAHNHLGLAYYGLQKKDLAKREILRAVEIDPKYSDAYINLGTMASDEGNRAEAREYYRRALDNLEYKLRHRALTNLAQVELSDNNLDKARELLYQSLQANPDYCLSHFLMGVVYTRDGNPARASQEFKQSVAKTCASNPEGHYQLGLSYMKVKQYDKARQEFVYLIQEHPETAQAGQAGEQLKNIP